MDSITGHPVPESRGAPRRIRRRSRWLTAGATLGALALALSACGSSASTHPSSSKASTTTTPSSSSVKPSSASVAGLYGSLPPTGTPKSGGTITIGTLKGSTPNYAMPIVPAADASVYTAYDFIDLMNQPLYWSPTGAKVAIDQPLSLADLPTYSNGGKTVTVQIKPWKWSNGQTVTANDVVEFIDILKAAVKESAANFGNYTPGFFPDNVASATAKGQTLTLQLTKKYNPAYFTEDQLGLAYAFPPQWAITKTGGKPVNFANPANAKAIYNYLNKQASDLATFGTNPLWKIADGPMEPSAFNPTTGAYTMVPNPDYSGPQKARITLKALVYTSTQAEFNNLESGALDIGGVDYSDLPSVGRIKSSYNVFGYPDYGWQGAMFNFADKTGDFNNIIGQLYIRQALAHLVDQKGIITGLLHGAGDPSYGPVPAIPKNPYAPGNATSAPYPYSLSAAKALLTSHGWKVVPGGQTVCANASKCAPNGSIPAGTKLAFNWQYGNSPPLLGQMSTAFASAAKQLGIEVTLQQHTFNYLIGKDSDPSSPSTKNTWAVVDFGGFTNSLYPTTESLFNTGGSFNEGGYNSSKADTLIHNSVYGSSASAVTKEASFLTGNVPVLFQPNPDLIIAVKKGVSGTANSMLAQTQYTWEPQFWYLTK